MKSYLVLLLLLTIHKIFAQTCSLFTIVCKVLLGIFLFLLKYGGLAMGASYSVLQRGGEEAVTNMRCMIRRCSQGAWKLGGLGGKAACVAFVIFCCPCACCYCVFWTIKYFMDYRKRTTTQGTDDDSEAQKMNVVTAVKHSNKSSPIKKIELEESPESKPEESPKKNTFDNFVNSWTWDKPTHKEKNRNFLFYTNKLCSVPDGDFIDVLHDKWFGDYRRLERHHGFIQWLFPLRERGVNYDADPLNDEEIELIRRDPEVRERLVKSFELMLDFYGMKLIDEKIGCLKLSEQWKERQENMNRNTHNNLRICRIIKCLEIFDFNHLSKPFVHFLAEQIFVHNRLPKCKDSCTRFWLTSIPQEQMEDILQSVKEEKQELIKCQEAVNNSRDPGRMAGSNLWAEDSTQSTRGFNNDSLWSREEGYETRKVSVNSQTQSYPNITTKPMSSRYPSIPTEPMFSAYQSASTKLMFSGYQSTATEPMSSTWLVQDQPHHADIQGYNNGTVSPQDVSYIPQPSGDAWGLNQSPLLDAESIVVAADSQVTQHVEVDNQSESQSKQEVRTEIDQEPMEGEEEPMDVEEEPTFQTNSQRLMAKDEMNIPLSSQKEDLSSTTTNLETSVTNVNNTEEVGGDLLVAPPITGADDLSDPMERASLEESTEF